MIKSKAKLVTRLRSAVKAADEEQDKPVTQVKASHKRYALQIYKKMNLPKDIGVLQELIIAGFAYSLAMGTTPQNVYKRYKPAQGLFKAFIMQGTKKIQGGEEEATKPCDGSTPSYDN